MLVDPNANRPAPTLEDIQRMLAMSKPGTMPQLPGMTQTGPMGMLGSRGLPNAMGSDLSQFAMPVAGPARPLGFGMSGTGTLPQTSDQQGLPAMGGMFANAKAGRPPARPGDTGAAPPPADPSLTPPNLLTDDVNLPAPKTDIMTQMPDISNIPTRHPKFFEHHGLGEKLLKGVGEFALQYSASQGNPAAMATLQNRMLQQRQQQLWAHEDATHRQDHQWDVDAATAKARLPEYFMSGRDRVAYDPASGTSKVVYDGPSDAQDYADALGLKPGTTEYNTAVSDFVLRGNGATAFQNKTDYEGVRQDDRVSLEGVRQGNRVQLRGVPTYAAAHPRAPTPQAPTPNSVMGGIYAKMAAGGKLSPTETTLLSNYTNHGRYRPGIGGGAPAPSSGGGKVYQNAQGHKITWNGSAWVPAQ